MIGDLFRFAKFAASIMETVDCVDSFTGSTPALLLLFFFGGENGHDLKRKQRMAGSSKIARTDILRSRVSGCERRMHCCRAVDLRSY